jgi:hypothetical protein
MKISLLLTVVAASVIVSGGSRLATASADAMQSAPTFSSSYTPLTKCGSGMTKKEEREAEERGSDIPSQCKGPDGYNVEISYGGCFSNFTVTRGEENITLGMQSVGWKQKQAEWRLANGKPFAVIIRMYDYAGNALCSTAGRITNEFLVVKGLKGFEHIDEKVKASTPNANVKAREIADKGYLKPKS